MKNFLLGLLFLFSIPLYSQVIVLENTKYTSYFDTVKNYPVTVEWIVTRDMVSCDDEFKQKRSRRFFKDERVFSDFFQNYRKSGYDRGHMMPNSDNSCLTKEVVDESFLFTNMSPQHPKLNQQDWNLLEKYTRDIAFEYGEVKVVAHNKGEIDLLYDKRGRTVSVPDSLYKELFFEDENKTYHLIYGFSNSENQNRSITDNLIKKTIKNK